MYTVFFGFREKPFKLVPNPAFLFLGKSHEEALAHLTYATSQGDGFVEITGEVGTGKTTLCRVFLEDLDQNVDAAFIFNSKLNSTQLLKAVHRELDIEYSSDDPVMLTESLNRFLLEKKAAGRSVVLLIDEAQHLGKDTLEQLRLLSNLETTKDKLMQIILVGQPELGRILDTYELRQLRQRINLSCHIMPLTLKETCGYIDHRIRVASRKNQDLFSSGAKKIIYGYSNGIPRRINIICDRSLLVAYSLGRHKINAAVVKQAIKELSPLVPEKKQNRSQRTKTGRAAAAILCCAALLAAAFLMKDTLHLPAVFNTDRMAEKSRTIPEPAPPSVISAGDESPGGPVPSAILPVSAAGTKASVENVSESGPSSPDQHVTEIRNGMERADALSKIMRLWKHDPVPGLDLLDRRIKTDSDFFRISAMQNSFFLLRADKGLHWIETFDLPVILHLAAPENYARKFIVLSRISDGCLCIEPDAGTRKITRIKKSDLMPLLAPDVLFICKNIFGPERIISTRSSNASRLGIKLLLSQMGIAGIDTTPVFDPATAKAVKDIQAKYGLETDGLVGPLTKLALMREKNDAATPFLTAEKKFQ